MPDRYPEGVLGLDQRYEQDLATSATEPLRLGGRPLPVVGAARLYVCGITPYDVTHLGHAATFVWADVLASVLRSTGVDVHVCRNVTDVDDVLLDAAVQRQRRVADLSLSQEFLFEQEMAALRVRPPTAAPRARGHIGAAIRLGEALLVNDAAYVRDGHVLFRGGGVPARSGLDRERALRLATENGDHPDDGTRDDPFDVPVWRPSQPEEPAWPSPWGWGRPGWHGGCAAMALTVHGPCVDVLVGGDDLAFPHHAYQAAMVEAATGAAPFARARVGVGTVRTGGAKMAKSTGNLVLVADLLREHRPAAVRLLLLDRHWAQPWDFEPADLTAAEQRLDELYSALGRPGGDGAVGVRARLRDELDVPGAVQLALESGGDAARVLVEILGLD